MRNRYGALQSGDIKRELLDFKKTTCADGAIIPATLPAFIRFF